ncbi:MAG: acetyl-CoA carboxylase biotin carboxylase subunit [Planctomycetes bacterium]|nr:acetyl-CoA carboxylase biotin carboxylase subunit [Planctomycetota bacterium]
MFSRILVANRGEIALRVIRACKELGIETVAVYSEADAGAIYLQYADKSICIGPAPAAKSYLDIARIISTAEITDVQAIHPGYGFLAENSHFAEVCRSCNIQFIGPSPEASRAVGDKVRARALAIELGIPVSPGSDKPVADEKEAVRIAHEIGFPVMIKAAAGGGGRGMRVARNDVSLVSNLYAAQAEAQAAFKDPSVYIEKLVEHPRHVEIQVLGDEYGNLVHLGERDCTTQRRHQKLVEESPSPVLTEDLRRRMGECAVRFARAARYTNAGTVEFLVDDDGNFFFMEMNARIQVEHPVTEMVTGIDLVKEQIRIAAGRPLGYRQEDVRLRGAAIECRINAEDSMDGFRPSPGLIRRFILPGGLGVRVDTHAHAGYTIPPTYDSMIGKLIVHRPSREEALLTMRRALEEFVVEGVQTTIPFFLDLFSNAQFLSSDIDTNFVETYLGKRG